MFTLSIVLLSFFYCRLLSGWDFCSYHHCICQAHMGMSADVGLICTKYILYRVSPSGSCPKFPFAISSHPWFPFAEATKTMGLDGVFLFFFRTILQYLWGYLNSLEILERPVFINPRKITPYLNNQLCAYAERRGGDLCDPRMGVVVRPSRNEVHSRQSTSCLYMPRAHGTGLSMFHVQLGPVRRSRIVVLQCYVI